ncbi:hypothetical protein [uncultured Microbacterium sp.]|uniref:hypothetical protein n=1 Tax=uncultured Microbacterium sp. TaxID=191216 RepID=UPI0035CB41D5
MEEDTWYASRRARWKPDRVRLLMIAESAPDSGGDVSARRFFYDERLTGDDSLFREVVKVLYDSPSLASGPGQKVPWLAQLQRDGVYLIDLASRPVNYDDPQARAGALKANIDKTIQVAEALQPNGIVLIKKNVFELLAEPLRRLALPVLHEQFITFPGSGQQKRFRQSFATAIVGLRL